MNTFITLVLAVAATSAQLYPYYPTVYGYAPSYAYSQYGSPVAYSHTALDSLNPLHQLQRFPASHPYFHQYSNQLLSQPIAVSASPLAEPIAPAAPAIKAVKVEPVAEEPTEDIVVADEAGEASVIEASEEPEKVEGPLTLRRIFPIFGSDLRGALEGVAFVRPDQIKVIKPEEDGDIEAIEAANEDSDRVAVVPAFRSLFPGYSGFLPARSFLAPAILSTEK